MSGRSLYTEVAFEESTEKLGLESGALFMGSCFADKMGQRLLSLHFPNIIVNPFGISYNPISLSRQLSALTTDEYSTLQLVLGGGLWHSWDHHGRFSHQTKEGIKKKIEEEFDRGRDSLKSCQHIFLTLGTAWIYSTVDGGYVVNNRHKMPADHFNPKEMVYSSEVAAALQEAIQKLPSTSKKSIHLCVSPIRHWRDGATDNMASKASLLQACHMLVSTIPEVDYVPTYELMMDELRDYRFYADDLLHPSELAENIIWERFISAYFTHEAQTFISEMEAFQRMRSHRVLHPESAEARQFRRKVEERAKELRSRYPFLSEVDI